MCFLTLIQLITKLAKGREIHLKDLKNICKNLECRKQSCSLKKQFERKRHLAQPVAKGSYSNSCEIMGSGGMNKQAVYKRRAQLSGSG